MSFSDSLNHTGAFEPKENLINAQFLIPNSQPRRTPRYQQFYRIGICELRIEHWSDLMSLWFLPYG